jgi:iron(III) transport system permease protein
MTGESLKAAGTTGPPLRRRRRPGRRRLGIGSVLLLILLVYLVIGPIVMLILSSAEDTSAGVAISPPFPWTIDNVVTVLADPRTYAILGSTLVFSIACLVIAFVISLTLAWLVERTDLPFPGFVYVITVAPAGMPGVISAIAWGLLMNPTNGVLNLVLRHFGGGTQGPLNAYTLPGMIFVQSLALVPLTFLLVTASLRNMNPNLEDAARTSGASAWTVLRRVSVPLLTPVLIGALIYQFVTVVEGVDIPLVLGLPGHVTVFSTQVYLTTHPAFGLPNYGVSSMYGILLLILAAAPLLLYYRVIRKAQDYATVGGKSFRPRKQRLGRWRWIAFALIMLYVLVSFVLPLLMLIYASLQPYLGLFSFESFSRFTLAGWTSTLGSSLFWSSLGNTIAVGLGAAAAVMLLSVGLSWIIVRAKSRISWLTDALAFIPHAIPGVVIALAVLLIYLVIPVPVFGTIWIIVIAMATQYLSLGTRLATGGISQIQIGLEEAARTSGARGWRVWGRVLLPLLRPVLINGFLLVFLNSIKNLTLPLVLQSSDNVVLSTLIWTSWNDGKVAETAVLSVILTAVTVVASILLRRFSGAQEEL